MTKKTVEEITAHVSNERRHMAAVKNTLTDVLQKSQGQNKPYKDFYMACVTFLEFIMERFHAQDQGSVDMLRKAVPESDTESIARIDDLHDTMLESRRQIDTLIEARKTYESAGDAGQDAFEKAAISYCDYFNSVLSLRKHSIRDIADRYYSEEERRQDMSVTDEAIAKEKELHDTFLATLPKGFSVIPGQRPD